MHPRRCPSCGLDAMFGSVCTSCGLTPTTLPERVQAVLDAARAVVAGRCCGCELFRDLESAVEALDEET